MPGEDCVDDLRDDRIVVADDAGKNRFVVAEFLDQILADLVFDAASANIAAFDGGAKLSEGRWSGPGPHTAIMTP